MRARGGAGWWGDVDISSVPSLAGYVESKPRPGSEVLLETVTEKHPVLSTWRYGLGRVTTFGTEPVGAGTQPWKDWSEYSRALTRILQRSAADARDPFRFEVEHDGGEIIIHAIRQQPRGQSESLPVAKLVGQDEPRQRRGQIDSMESLTFIPRSPDRFIARLPAPPIGETLRMETSASTTPARWQPLVAVSPVASENRVDPRASVDMARLVSIAGGNRFDPSADWTDAATPAPSGQRIFSAASWLFGLALLLFLAEIIWRRLPLRTLPTPNAIQRRFAFGAARSRTALGVVFILCWCGRAPAETKIADNIAAQANSLIETSIRDGVDRDRVDELFRSAVLSAGSAQPILDWLSESRSDLNVPRGQVIAELEVHIASRRGDLERAAYVLAELLQVKGIAQQRHDLQIWQAKLSDALGDVEAAKKIYESLIELDLSNADQQAIRLRLALMGLIANAPNRAGNDAKPLIELANQSKDISFRNRAANVLAVQNKHAEAIKLFTIQGEGTGRFRSASRVTEWAIRAGDRDQAIKTAWDAVGSAELKRDRNYALALLVESYRLKQQRKGLEEARRKTATEERSRRRDVRRDANCLDQSVARTRPI